MPHGLKRLQQSMLSHFITFTCYHRQPRFHSEGVRDLFVRCLEDIRRRFRLCVYGYVVMPEHVHLLLSEPERGCLSDAIHDLKLCFTKRLPSVAEDASAGAFWQKRYYDRNVRDTQEFAQKLRYLHRNPVKRGLVNDPQEWKWSSFRHYALREVSVVQIESEWTARDRESQAQGRSTRIFLIPGWLVEPLANLGHFAVGLSPGAGSHFGPFAPIAPHSFPIRHDTCQAPKIDKFSSTP